MFATAALVVLALALVLVVAAGIVDGSVAPALVYVIGAGLLTVAAGRVALPSERGWSRPLVLGAYALRSGVAAVLVLRSLALGNGGFTTGDDVWYASAAGHLVRWLQGDPELPYVPPYWNGEYYLMTTYVFVESAVFWAFGQHVLNMILVNALAGGLTVLLVSDMAGRMFGRAAGIAAGLVLALYPSIVLWSAVNLRDTMIVLFITMTLWALARFREHPGVPWIVAAFLFAWAEEGLRVYVEAVLLGVALLAVIVVFVRTRPRRRLRWPAIAAALFLILLVHSGLTVFVTRPFETLGNIVEVRMSNQFGRTAFGPPPPQASVAPTGGPSPTPTSTTATSPAVTPPAAPATASLPAASAATATAAVTAAPPTAAPTATVTPLQRLVRGEIDREVAVSSSLAHFPFGVAHTLFAPFPWAIRTSSELAAMPDMAVWYLVLGGAVVTLWVRRRSWDLLFPDALFLGTLLFLLALGEGNVGTLFRHRAMAVPAAVVLASPSLAALGRRLLSAASHRRARSRAALRIA